MGPATDALGAYLFDALWQSTLWLAAGLVAAALLAKRPARAHGALLLALGGAVATPPASALIRALGWGVLSPPVIASGAGGARPAGLLAGPGAEAAGIDWMIVAAAAWAVLSLAVAVRLGASMLLGRRLVAAARPLRSATFSRLALEAARRLGLRRVPEILASPRVSSPVIWCWGRRPRVLLPQPMAAAGGGGEIFGVLCHELSHLRRGDHLAGLASELALCVLPWHPLAWWARRRAGLLSEQACDAWVLAAGEPPTRFAEALLSLVVQPRKAWALAAAGDRRGVGLRIRRILEQRPSNPDPGSRWTALCFVAAVALGTTAALAQRRPAVFLEPPAHEHVEPAGPGDAAGIEVQDAAPGDVLVAPPQLNLGLGAPYLPREGSVWLINSGAQPRRVLSAVTNCECTEVIGFEPQVLAPGDTMEVLVRMTAPNHPGGRKTKFVTFKIEGRPSLRLPVHLEAAGRDP